MFWRNPLTTNARQRRCEPPPESGAYRGCSASSFCKRRSKPLLWAEDGFHPTRPHPPNTLRSSRHGMMSKFLLSNLEILLEFVFQRSGEAGTEEEEGLSPPHLHLPPPLLPAASADERSLLGYGRGDAQGTPLYVGGPYTGLTCRRSLRH